MTLSERTDSDPTGCQTNAPYTDRLPVSELPEGRTICVATDQGQLATVVITATGSHEVTMTYELWQID